MAAGDVAVIRTGTANLASVIAGLRRAGVTPQVTESPEEVLRAEHVVLPGVGSFGPAMSRLRARRLDVALATRTSEERPILAICLGLQLLCAQSEETPGLAGLGVIRGRVGRFPDGVRIPQIGWNFVAGGRRGGLVRSGHAYFANSYRLAESPPGWSCVFAEYGGRFVAALQRGSIVACQFHPELSGRWGLDLLRRWLKTTQPVGDLRC